MRKYPLLVLIVLLFTLLIQAQQDLYIPINIQEAYTAGSRDLSGEPGKNYWQNKAEYDMQVKLDPVLSKISGKEKILYTNNSPDTLKEIVISILSDILKKGNQNDFGIPLASLNDGVIISSLKLQGEEIDLISSAVTRTGTNLILQVYPVQEGILPGQQVELEIAWKFVYPKLLTIRCGDYGDSTFFVAYFYPKIAVYDDVDGWDRHNYTGFGEFYGDHSDYKVSISVPKDFKVWATGELQNADQVFTPKYYDKWKEAQVSMEVYSLIDNTNYLDGDITKNKDWNTWVFMAEEVPDFAFGSSDKFLWDIVNVEVDEKSGRTSTFNAAYRVDSEDYYKMANLGKKVLKDYSSKIPGLPYPYPEMTIFNGNSGMEFPMMCNNVSCEPWHETAGLAYHEVAHTYFPFYIGTNERKYAWMDEGWASLLPYFYFKDHSPEFDYFSSRKDRYYSTAGKEIEVSIMTPGDLLTIRAPYRQASYNKPFFAYYYIYDYLGKKLFSETFKKYMVAWAGKHPIPYDFFYAFNNFSGQNLNWYWNNWFFQEGHADLVLEGLKDDEVIVKNKGGLYLPVDLHIEYKDGMKENMFVAVSVWESGNKELRLVVNRPEDIKRLSLGNEKILDVDLSNNTLEIE